MVHTCYIYIRGGSTSPLCGSMAGGEYISVRNSCLIITFKRSKGWLMQVYSKRCMYNIFKWGRLILILYNTLFSFFLSFDLYLFFERFNCTKLGCTFSYTERFKSRLFFHSPILAVFEILIFNIWKIEFYLQIEIKQAESTNLLSAYMNVSQPAPQWHLNQRATGCLP